MKVLHAALSSPACVVHNKPVSLSLKLRLYRHQFVRPNFMPVVRDFILAFNIFATLIMFAGNVGGAGPFPDEGADHA